MRIYDERVYGGHEFDSEKYEGFLPPSFESLRQLSYASIEPIVEDMTRDMELLDNLITTDIMSIDVTPEGIVPTPGLISDLAPVVEPIYVMLLPTYDNLTVLSWARYRQIILNIEAAQVDELNALATNFLGMKGFLISEAQRRIHQTIQELALARRHTILHEIADIELEIDARQEKYESLPT